MTTPANVVDEMVHRLIRLACGDSGKVVRGVFDAALFGLAASQLQELVQEYSDIVPDDLRELNDRFTDFAAMYRAQVLHDCSDQGDDDEPGVAGSTM